ncbi:MAG: ribonuclease D [Gemmatimonadaceae bacterium]|nr:ribonuclease D [Gemmatimonadaceae bacterium]
MATRVIEGAIYLDEVDSVDALLAEIGPSAQIAVDTEGASFHRFLDRIYLLQLSTRERSAIIDPIPTGKLDRLGTLLEDRTVEVVFHDADYDLRLLRQDYGWRVTNIFDTRVAAQLLGIKSFGLAALLQQYFDVKLDKKHQRADWSMRPLPDDMLEYAAQDTRFLLQLRDHLHAELEAKGRLHWAKEEFALLESIQWEPGPDPDAYQRIKGARDLARRELAVLRELAVWRDAAARDLDRATFRVIGNETLLEISRAAPKTMQELTQIKGTPRALMERAGHEVLAAVKRGMEVPEKDLPKFPKSLRWNKDPDFDDRVARLKAVRDEAADRLQLDPGVLGSREKLETVARANPKLISDFAAIPTLRRWQVEEMGEQFIRALNNTRS